MPSQVRIPHPPPILLNRGAWGVSRVSGTRLVLFMHEFVQLSYLFGCFGLIFRTRSHSSSSAELPRAKVPLSVRPAELGEAGVALIRLSHRLGRRTLT